MDGRAGRSQPLCVIPGAGAVLGLIPPLLIANAESLICVLLPQSLSCATQCVSPEESSTQVFSHAFLLSICLSLFPVYSWVPQDY